MFHDPLKLKKNTAWSSRAIRTGTQDTASPPRVSLHFWRRERTRSGRRGTHAVVPSRYDKGYRVGYMRLGTRTIEDHGSSSYNIHSGDYHAMLRLARGAPGVRIQLNAAVRDEQPDPTFQGGPCVTLASGEILYVDAIIGVDGVKSTLQKVATGLDDAPIPSGDASYRATHTH